MAQSTKEGRKSDSFSPYACAGMYDAKKNLQAVFYNVHDLIHGKTAAVNAKIILGHVHPFGICKIFVVGTALFVHLFDQLPYTCLFPSCAADHVLNPVLKRRMDKNT